MKAILIREIKSFFGSPIGILIIGIFLVINGLFLWVVENPYNILNSGYADLSPLFFVAPAMFLFLIPALSMKSFSDEIKLGTIELLLTKPISLWHIVLGKFFAIVTLILIALLPTLTYVWIIDNWSAIPNSLDYGSIIGSYFGTLFLVAAFASISVYCSALTDNPIVAFITSVIICGFMFYGFDMLSNLSASLDLLSYFGLQYHFKSIARGVIDTRNLIYFSSISYWFLYKTVVKLKSFQK